MKKIKRYIKNNPLIKWIVFVLLGVLGVFLIKKIVSLVGSSGFVPVSEVGLKPLSSDNVVSDGGAISIANELYEAMAGAGTDEYVINLKYSYLRNSSESLLKVYNAFGYKPYSYFGSPSLWFSGEQKDLKGWLMAELSESKYKEWANLFTKAGI